MSVLKMLQGTKPQDEWMTPAYAVKPLLQYLKPNSNILCPFDKEDSAFVNVLHDAGHYISYAHIEDGLDFFDLQDAGLFDYIISNPPYSKKDRVFEHLFKLGKSFAMLMGVVGIMEGKRFELFKNKKLEVMWLKPRIHFIGIDGVTGGQPPFQSCYVCHKVLPKAHMFIELKKE